MALTTKAFEGKPEVVEAESEYEVREVEPGKLALMKKEVKVEEKPAEKEEKPAKPKRARKSK